MKNCREYLDIIINNLNWFIIDSLVFDYNNHFQGFAKLDNLIIRIDMIIVPIENFFCALMHFTGSGLFNQYMRQHAIKLGYKLNEYNLINTKNNKKFKISGEDDIFKYLHLQYIKPIDR